MSLTAGVARTVITPYAGVELAGCGYFPERQWTTVQQNLHATAVVLTQGEQTLAIVSCDLYRVGPEFCAAVQQHLSPHSEFPAECLLISATGSCGAPTTTTCLGHGEVDEFYTAWAARQTATAILQAARQQQPVTARSSHSRVSSLLQQNAAGDGGVDTTLTTLWLHTSTGQALTVLFNIALGADAVAEPVRTLVHRDRGGRVCELLESTIEGVTAMFLPGGGDDVEIVPARCTQPGFAEAEILLAGAVQTALAQAEPVGEVTLQTRRVEVALSTRRWGQPEIDAARNESQRRLKDVDSNGWQQTLGRQLHVTPDDVSLHYGNDEWLAVRALCRFQLGWTFLAMQDLDTRPETLTTPVQHLRIGSLSILTTAAGVFGKLALDVRQRLGNTPVMLVSHANGHIGPLPDAESIQRQDWLTVHGPKLLNQFPFTPQAPTQLADALVQLVRGSGS